MQAEDKNESPATPKESRKDKLLSQAFFRDKNVAEADQRPGDRAGKIVRRLALCLLPVVILVAAGDLAARKLVPIETLLPYMQKEIAFYTMKVENFLELPTPDLIVVGSSRTRNGVNAEMLSKALSTHWGRPARAYNLGLDGAMIEEFYGLVNSRLPDPAPPYVVICVSGMEVTQFHNFYFAPRFLWKFSDLVSYLSRVSYREFDARAVEYFIEAQLCRYWYAFKHRDALMQMIKERAGVLLGVESSKRSAKAHTSERRQRELTSLLMNDFGYAPESHRKANFEEQLKNDPKSIPRITKKRLEKDAALFEDMDGILERLRLTVDAVRSKGSKLIFVECPPSPFDQYGRVQLCGEGFRNWMTEVAKKLDVPFIPIPPKGSGLTNDLYSDASHLSPEGADRFTKVLFLTLRESGFLDGQK